MNFERSPRRHTAIGQLARLSHPTADRVCGASDERGWPWLLATSAAKPQEVFQFDCGYLLSLRDTGCKQPVPP
ncbi:MAG: hypothetical protein ACI93T_002411 [Porticoccaceae bacterium]|jgi:hypothetical protein